MQSIIDNESILNIEETFNQCSDAMTSIFDTFTNLENYIEYINFLMPSIQIFNQTFLNLAQSFYSNPSDYEDAINNLTNNSWNDCSS